MRKAMQKELRWRRRGTVFERGNNTVKPAQKIDGEHKL
jgi:hypothetical protein